MSRAPDAVKDAVEVLKTFFCPQATVSPEGDLEDPNNDFSEVSDESDRGYEPQISLGTIHTCSSITISIILSIFIFCLLLWQNV